MKEQGLYQKYVVTKASGKPIPPEAEFIVLRIDDGRYVGACRAGVAAFAARVRVDNPTLSNDLFARLKAYEIRDLGRNLTAPGGR